MILSERRFDFTELNKDYNAKVTSLVGDILGTHRIYPEYVSAFAFEPNLPSLAQTSNPDAHVVKEPAVPAIGSTARFDVADLGVYEQVVFSCLAWGAYSIYCMVGEMGSGKSATAQYIERVLLRKRHATCGRCVTCRPVAIRLDFNEGFTSTDTEILLKQFKTRLYQQLKIFIRDAFKNGVDVQNFVDTVRKREFFNTLAGFDDFIETIDASVGDWEKLTNRQKTHRLFAFIKDQEDNDARVELLMRVLGYISKLVLPEPACVVVIYDNLDKLRYEAQMAILFALMGLQSMADVRALVPLRRTSFEKLASQRVYSFGVINHTGPTPVEIIRRRVTHYLENFDKEQSTRSVDKVVAAGLRQRLRYIANVLSHESGHLADMIRSVPGDSVRLGLFMMERAFVNNVVPFDRDPISVFDLGRALIVGEASEQRLSPNDEVVANVFCDGRSSKPTLLVIRILAVLHAYYDVASRRSLGNVVALLREIGGWNVREVLHALNYLLNFKRPLVWVDGRTEFKLGTDAREALPSREILFLTRAGERYLRHLASELAYFQECVAALDWPIGRVPTSMDITDVESRMGALRSCFVVLQAMDGEQYVRYDAYKQRDSHQSLPLMLMTNRILYGLGKAALLIFEAQNVARRSVADEWRNWHSQLIQSLNLEEGLTGRRNPKLGSLEERFAASLKTASAM